MKKHLFIYAQASDNLEGGVSKFMPNSLFAFLASSGFATLAVKEISSTAKDAEGFRQGRQEVIKFLQRIEKKSA